MATTKELIEQINCLFTENRMEAVDTPVTTPLLPKAIEILKKYKRNLRAAVTGTVFPVISNQKINAYLKEIAEICGINKKYHLPSCKAYLCNNGSTLQRCSDRNGE